MKTNKNKKKNLGRVIFSMLLVVAIMAITFCTFARVSIVVPAQLPATSTNAFYANGGGLLQSVTVINTNTTANLSISFYDSPNTNVFYTNAAYTSYTNSYATVTNIYTDVLGHLQTNTYSAYTKTLMTNSAATNTWPLITTLVVPTNSTAVWTAGGVRFTGLLSTNNATGHGGITYVIDGYGN